MKKLLEKLAVFGVFTVLFVIGLFLEVNGTQAQAATKTKMSKCTIKVEDGIYKGKKVVPKVTVKYKKKTLKEGTDYKLTFKNNKCCGEASCTVEGKGKYKGKVTKQFNIVPASIKTAEFITDSYIDYRGDIVQTVSVKYKTVKGATGYKLYFSDTKDGYYSEFMRVEAIVDRVRINLAAGTYIKIQPYFYEDGQYYDAEMSEAFKVDYQPLIKSLTSYEVTNSALKAPSSVELVYESYTDIYGDVFEPELCLKVTNGADISCKYWFVECIDMFGNSVSTGCYSTYEVEPGQEVYLRINNYAQLCIDGTVISKIRIIPSDAGSDYSFGSPWNLEGDDTFGEEYILECSIRGHQSYAGKAEITFEEADWGDTASLSGLVADYQSLDFTARDSYLLDGYEDYVNVSFYRYNDHYNVSVSGSKEALINNPEYYSCTLIGAYEFSVSGNTADILFHAYDVIVK